MTTGAPRPADAARRALRAARERAETDREAARDGVERTAPAEQPPSNTPAVSHTPGGGADGDDHERSADRPAAAEARPGEAAREALRAAVAARSVRREAADSEAPRTEWAADGAAPGRQDASNSGRGGSVGAASGGGGVSETGRAEVGVALGRGDVSPAGRAPARAVPGREDASAAGPAAAEAASGRVGEPAADDAADGRPRGQRDTRTSGGSATEAAPSSASDTVHGVRPEQLSGEAPPAGARPGDVAREALRAARRQALLPEVTQPDDRRPRRTPARPATAHPGTESRTTRSPAAHDMRQFLATAFRMPSGTDTLEDLEEIEDLEVTDDADIFGNATTRIAPQPPAPTPEPGAEAPASDARVSADRGAGPSDPGAVPHVPATMATPHRDTELRRTFPAFRARPASAQDAAFAETWWGNAWVEALEQGALDVKRLGRGRGYADGGDVDAITVTPGLVLAYVRGSRPRPYRVQVRLRTLDDADWERFLDAAADRPGHIAALLDKELPQSLADCGVPLLPGPGDLAPRCSCPDSGHPCKHAAALCYQTARLLDADPFVLLLLRGRGERNLLDALSRRSAARAARAAQERQPGALPGVRASEVLAPRQLPPLPMPLPPPPHPEQPPVYPAAPGGPDPFALDQLATDAAARAHALLTSGRDPVGELTLWEDAVRLAAARPGSGLTATTRALYATLATATGRTTADLARAVAAWRQGGLAGLTVLEEPWDPPAGRFDRARPLLLAADLPAFRPRRNHLTHPRGHVQLRLGRDGLWYAYESEPGQDDWWPRGTPDLDPVGALTGLDTANDL